MNEMMIVVVSVVGLLLGFGVAYFIGNKVAGSKIQSAENDAKKKTERC